MWGLKAKGRVENTSGEEQSLVQVYIVCYDSDG
ncbi:MAG: FxLYD domain-containing protein [Oscillospiraceae bacterium]|nr:FxLYD domain-containing protein [Oscillospiraceae bacterium]